MLYWTILQQQPQPSNLGAMHGLFYKGTKKVNQSLDKLPMNYNSGLAQHGCEIPWWTSIGSGKGLAWNRQQAIIWTNADPVQWCIYVIYAAPGGDELNLRAHKFQHCINIASFIVWIRYFVWNFKGTLWNSKQNILSIYGKMCSKIRCENLRAPRLTSLKAFVKHLLGVLLKRISMAVMKFNSNHFHITVPPYI